MDYNTHSFFFPDQTLPMGTGLVDCGHEFIDPARQYHWDGMHRGSNVFYIWQYTVSGRGAIILDGVSHPLLPGQAFFVRVPHEHVYYLPKDSDTWEVLFLTLYGCETERIGSEFIRRYGNIVTHSGHSRTVTFAKEVFRESISALPENRYRTALAAYEFLLTLFQEQEESGNAAPGIVLMQKANAYLQEHLAEPVSISKLAEVCGYSRSHFSRKFHAASGKTPQEYLRDMRMHLALRLLQTTQKNIKETAACSGFEDASYFCRVFRQQFGMPPERYRSGKIISPVSEKTEKVRLAKNTNRCYNSCMGWMESEK